MLVSVRKCGSVVFVVFDSAVVSVRAGSVMRLDSLRAGSVATPSITRSGAPDDEIYAPPETNHGSANPLELDVGNHWSVGRVVV